MKPFQIAFGLTPPATLTDHLDRASAVVPVSTPTFNRSTLQTTGPYIVPSDKLVGTLSGHTTSAAYSDLFLKSGATLVKPAQTTIGHPPPRTLIAVFSPELERTIGSASEAAGKTVIEMASPALKRLGPLASIAAFFSSIPLLKRWLEPAQPHTSAHFQTLSSQPPQATKPFQATA